MKRKLEIILTNFLLFAIEFEELKSLLLMFTVSFARIKQINRYLFSKLFLVRSLITGGGEPWRAAEVTGAQGAICSTGPMVTTPARAWTS